MSYKEFIKNNDFESAKEKFDNANNRWRNYWFEACKQIFSACAEWAKYYIIDTINQTIIKIKDCITKAKPKEPTTSHTYLIKMFNDLGEWVYTKIGKANDLNRRFKQLKHTYKDSQTTISKIEVIKEYETQNDDLAQVLESLMRNYFRKTHKFIPNDRFEPFEPSEEDLNQFENYYNMVCAI